MYDARMFTDRYDRYAAALPESASGQVALGYGASPTAASQPCLFNPKGGTWNRAEAGLTFDYDAELRIPEASTLKPEKRGDAPDKVVVTRFNGTTIARTFTVIWVYSAHGQHKRALLKELMP